MDDQRVARSRTYMAAGLLFSFLGSSVVAGLLPGAVAVGIAPLILIPALTTLETVQDMSSPFVARLLVGRSPSRLLVGCEVVDFALCALALTLAAFSALSVLQCAIGYLFAASFISLVVDIAEELFAGEIQRVAPGSALKFNVMLYSLLGVAGLLIAKPLGAALADAGATIVLLINLGASAAGVMLRSVAARQLPELDEPLNADEPTGADAERPSPREFWRSPGGPAVALLTTAASVMVVAYVSQFVAGTSSAPAPWITATMIAVGAGAVAGPHLARLATPKRGIQRTLRLVMAGHAASLAALLLIIKTPSSVSTSSRMLIVAGLGAIAALAAGSVVLQSTARQVGFGGNALGWVVGWSHAAASTGALLGSWLGIALSVESAPATGVALAAVIMVCSIVVTASER